MVAGAGVGSGAGAGVAAGAGTTGVGAGWVAVTGGGGGVRALASMPDEAALAEGFAKGRDWRATTVVVRWTTVSWVRVTVRVGVGAGVVSVAAAGGAPVLATVSAWAASALA